MKLLTNVTISDISLMASQSPISIQIASAFCKEAAFTSISEQSVSQAAKTLAVRWRFDDLVSGISDLSVYHLTQERGWKLYINNTLHAKAYIFDNCYVIGSSNLTLGGFPTDPKEGNTELSIRVNGTTEAITDWYNSLLKSSVPMDDELFALITEDLDEYLRIFGARKTIRRGFSPKVNEAIKSRWGSAMLYIADFPWTREPTMIIDEPASEASKHDAALLALTTSPDLAEIRKGFKSLPAYKWLLQQLDQPIFFGELSMRLHQALQDVPPPYRKDVKELTSNLVQWALALCPDEIMSDKPRHSTRIFRA